MNWSPLFSTLIFGNVAILKAPPAEVLWIPEFKVSSDGGYEVTAAQKIYPRDLSGPKFGTDGSLGCKLPQTWILAFKETLQAVKLCITQIDTLQLYPILPKLEGLANRTSNLYKAHLSS